MGVTCTKLLTSKDTAKKIAQNKVSVSNTLHKQETFGSKGNDTKLESKDFPDVDVLSKGDYHNMQSEKELSMSFQGQNVVIQDNLLGVISDYKQPVKHTLLTHNNSNVHAEDGLQTTQEGDLHTRSTVEDRDNKVLDDNNQCAESSKEQNFASAIEISTESKAEGVNENGNKVIVTVKEKDGLKNETHNADVSQNSENNKDTNQCEDTTEEEDRLMDLENVHRLQFFPLDENGQRCHTPDRMPGCLRNKPRKTSMMSYDERMLLADCNRFEQLDKRRAFAVRQNRSISRNGRLPKICEVGDSSVTPVASNESLTAVQE